LLALDKFQVLSRGIAVYDLLEVPLLDQQCNFGLKDLQSQEIGPAEEDDVAPFAQHHPVFRCNLAHHLGVLHPNVLDAGHLQLDRVDFKRLNQLNHYSYYLFCKLGSYTSPS